MVGGDVAADGPALVWITGVGRRERHGQDVSGDFGNHQPVGGWFGRIEERITGPDVADVVKTQPWVFEQVAGLLVDLEGPVLVEVVDTEPGHDLTVLQAITYDYASVGSRSATGQKSAGRSTPTRWPSSQIRMTTEVRRCKD